VKILTIAGTRPELIRLSIIIEKLDALVDHKLVYTNQNYDYNLSGRFFDEMNIRKPNYYFSHEAISFADFLSYGIKEFNTILDNEKPDKILILGDTNTGLLTILAERRKIPIYHMEAGNRCYDDRLPEETNRRIIDSLSKYNLPYTENSKQNLLNEGYHKNFVFKTGNPIFEVLTKNSSAILASTILEVLGVEKKDYVLATFHRAENVDDEESLIGIVTALNRISEKNNVIISLHPRTRSKLMVIEDRDCLDSVLNHNIIILEPLGFYSFVHLERNAKCVISDSGTVQEECCIYGVPALTIRKTTERQETIECGSNVLCGTKTEDIINAFEITMKRKNNWVAPYDYLIPNVSDTVINILIGN